MRPPVEWGRAHPLSIQKAGAPSKPNSAPWERISGEPEYAWNMYQAYQISAYPDGIPGRCETRSLAYLAQAAGVPFEDILTLSHTWKWLDRATAFDRALEDAQEHLTEDERRQRRLNRIKNTARTLVERELDKLCARAEFDSELGVVKPAELKQLLDLVLKVEAQAPVIQATETVDYSVLSMEEIEFLERIKSKLHAAAE